MIRRLRRFFIRRGRQLLITFLALLVLAALQWVFFRPHTFYDYMASVSTMGLNFILLGIFGVSISHIAISDYKAEIKRYLELEAGEELEEGFEPRVPETRVDIFYGLLIVGIPTFLIALGIQLIMLG